MNTSIKARVRVAYMGNRSDVKTHHVVRYVTHDFSARDRVRGRKDYLSHWRRSIRDML